jgi:hypothetical protein
MSTAKAENNRLKVALSTGGDNYDVKAKANFREPPLLMRRLLYMGYNIF